MKKHKLPKEILIYVCDELDDGTPVFAVARNADEIPEDVNGEQVGVYVQNTVSTFKVHKTL